jgi:hypothetical protein
MPSAHPLNRPKGKLDLMQNPAVANVRKWTAGSQHVGNRTHNKSYRFGCI